MDVNFFDNRINPRSSFKTLTLNNYVKFIAFTFDIFVVLQSNLNYKSKSPSLGQISRLPVSCLANEIAYNKWKE